MIDEFPSGSDSVETPPHRGDNNTDAPAQVSGRFDAPQETEAGSTTETKETDAPAQVSGRFDAPQETEAGSTTETKELGKVPDVEVNPESGDYSEAVSEGDGIRPQEPERLYRFGRKPAPNPVDLKKDLEVDNLDDIVGPYAPKDPKEVVPGISVFIDPEKSGLSGHHHYLPPGYELPPGLKVHADGKDVNGEQDWGHRTIYAAEPMTAREIVEFNDNAPWDYAGNLKKKKK
ncbi:hypothetical protein AB0M05_35255 [Streptomyces violaceusniger]|uniref:hypothetical protein n=1 Tax=Streptomyces violaceusniger TaxID=68280 RepID=UPI003435BCE8